MHSFREYRAVSARNRDNLYPKANRRKQALQKLAEYLRNERGYSDSEITKFIAESFIEAIECQSSRIFLKL